MVAKNSRRRPEVAEKPILCRGDLSWQYQTRRGYPHFCRPLRLQRNRRRLVFAGEPHPMQCPNPSPPMRRTGPESAGSPAVAGRVTGSRPTIPGYRGGHLGGIGRPRQHYPVEPKRTRGPGVSRGIADRQELVRDLLAGARAGPGGVDLSSTDGRRDSGVRTCRERGSDPVGTRANHRLAQHLAEGQGRPVRRHAELGRGHYRPQAGGGGAAAERRAVPQRRRDVSRRDRPLRSRRPRADGQPAGGFVGRFQRASTICWPTAPTASISWRRKISIAPPATSAGW